MNKILIIGLCSLWFCLSSNAQDSVFIDQLIDQKRAYNKSIKKIVGYKIQLYNGSESKVRAIKSRFRKLFPGYPVEIVYSSPEWKVQAGNIKSKLEADKILEEVKGKFEGAFVLKTKIKK